MSNDTQKTQDRKRLLANGYTPLPLDGKACYVKGWSAAEIDDEWLDGYNRSARFQNTGIRCDNIVAVDIDVDDQELADQIDDAITAMLPTQAVRWGDPATGRRLLMYYAEKPGRKQRSSMYGGFQVEILAGPGCQFAALGIHPKSGQPYEWEHGPLEVDVDQLPEITAIQVTDILEAVEALLAATGLEQTVRTHAGSGESSHDYCLTPEMQFEIVDPPLGLLTVAEIVAQIPKGRTWHCNMTAIRPDSDSGKGYVAMSHTGLMIHDFITDMTYFEALDLSEIMPDVPAQVVDSVFNPDGQTRLRRLLEQYVLMYDGTVRPLDSPTLKWRFDGWARANSFKVGKAKAANLFQDRAKTAHYAALLPHSRDRLVQKGTYTVLNTYLPPEHVGGAQGSPDLFYTFMAHLVPDDRQRSLVIDWIANKCQHPHQRMHGLVMVAHGVFGVGRGTLLNIMSQLLGPEYCVETSLAHLTGVTGQAQYNDYLSQSLLVSIPEAFEEKPKQGRWQSRHLAYEQLKLVVDTTSQQVLIRRKGDANTSEQLYASIFIATNHDDALAIPYGDRRLMVIENAGEALATADGGQLAEAIYKWMAKPSNIAALHADLLERVIAYDPFGPAPETQAKARMITAAESGPDQAWQAMLEDFKGDLITAAQWRSYANKAALRFDLDWPEPYNVENALRAVLKANSRPLFPDAPRRQVHVESQKVRPVVIRNYEQWGQHRGSDEIRDAVLKNGPPGGAVVVLPAK